MSDQNKYDDDLDTFDEGADSDDSWESFDEDADFADEDPAAAGDRAPKKKKKNSLFSLLLIGSVVLGGGVFAYTQLAGPQHADAPAPPSALPSDGANTFGGDDVSMPPMPTTIASSTTAPTTTNVGDGGADSALTESAYDGYSGAGFADDSAQTSELAPMDGEIPSRFAGDESQAPRLPSVDDILLRSAPSGQGGAGGTLAEAAPVDQAPVVPGSSYVEDKSLAVVNDAALSGRLEQMEKDIAALRSESAALLDLKENLARLERSLEDLKNTRPATAVPVTSTTSLEKAAPAQRPKPQILGATPSPQQAAPAPRTTTETVRWVLRGAQPGQAMVARAGDGDVQTVRPGDSLPGIGRITEIVYVDGRWKVRGTLGEISQ